MRRVVVVGAGGNIGSHLTPHLARLPEITHVTLVDRDRYERGNLMSQQITEQDVGRSKAEVQASALRRVRPGQVEVEAITAPIESLPWGLLRADLVLSCLDSRGARQRVNQMVWRLGVPWIDAGVEGSGLLARISVFRPGRDRPCLECGWDERDYDLIEQPYPCREGREDPEAVPPTGSPSGLGALAAALQVLEARKLLEGILADSDFGQEIILDAAQHALYVTSLRRNPHCRLAGHEPWAIERVSLTPPALVLGRALGQGTEGDTLESTPRWISVAGASFARRLVCAGCGASRKLLRLDAALRPRDRRCRDCGAEMEATGFDRVERLTETELSSAPPRPSLRGLGLRPGEVFTVGAGRRVRHFEIARERL